MGALVLTARRGAPPDPHVLRRMLAAAPHRGSAYAVHVDGDIGIGISNDPEQKDAWLATRNGSMAAFVGSLDNAAELDLELRRAGIDAGEGDPAATVLGAFQLWRDDAPARFRGAFVGAVGDAGRLVVFRDQLGHRPLFFRSTGSGFVAATEAKQVAAGAGIARRPDLDALEALFFGRLDTRRSMLQEIERFPRNAITEVGHRGELATRRYWDPSGLLETARLTPSEAQEQLLELLDQAVARSLTGEDVVSLSGGIDSPTIAALAAPRHLEIAGRPLQALSSVYPDYPSVDESAYIELVSRRLELPLHTYVPATRPLDDVAFWVDILDGPVDTLSIPELAENYRGARELGARNVLTGEMAEWVLTHGQHLRGHLILHGRIAAVGAWLREARAAGGSWRSILRGVAPSLTPAMIASPYLRLRGRDYRWLPSWIDRERAGGPPTRPDLARPARRRWLEHQLDPLRGPAAITFDADEMCAAYCGVQVRRPFSDIDLWEFCLSLPAEMKIPSSVPKAPLREAMRGRVPDAILDRRDKTGFSAHVLGVADYDGLRRWIVDSEYRLPGVDYLALAEHIESRNLDLIGLMWAYDLARVHAFVSLWQ